MLKGLSPDHFVTGIFAQARRFLCAHLSQNACTQTIEDRCWGNSRNAGDRRAQAGGWGGGEVAGAPLNAQYHWSGRTLSTYKQGVGELLWLLLLLVSSSLCRPLCGAHVRKGHNMWDASIMRLELHRDCFNAGAPQRVERHLFAGRGE